MPSFPGYLLGGKSAILSSVSTTAIAKNPPAGKLREFVLFIFSLYGGVAQWLEQSAHNRLVPGSSPGTPTIEKKSGFSVEF